MNLDTEELQDLLKRVTPGDWFTHLVNDTIIMARQPRPGSDLPLWEWVATTVHERDSDPDDRAYADAELIVKAKHLAAEVIRLREMLARFVSLMLVAADAEATNAAPNTEQTP